MNETTYTIIGENSNYVEEIPMYDEEVTQTEMEDYIFQSDSVEQLDNGEIVIAFFFDDETPNEKYTITRNS